MTDSLELDFAIRKAGLTREEVAKRIGLSLMALFNKINNRTEFKASEISSLTKVLKLNDEQRDRIFFASKVD